MVPNDDPASMDTEGDITEDDEVFAAEDYVNWLDEQEAADDKDLRSWDV